MVVIGRSPTDVALDNVRANSPTGIVLAVEHLYAQGRRRIALRQRPGRHRARRGPRRGYSSRRSNARACRTTPTCRSRPATSPSPPAARPARRCSTSARPDAVVCANDLLAVGAMHELAADGTRVPSDVAVVGMDDTELAELASPR